MTTINTSPTPVLLQRRLSWAAKQIDLACQQKRNLGRDFQILPPSEQGAKLSVLVETLMTFWKASANPKRDAIHLAAGDSLYTLYQEGKLDFKKAQNVAIASVQQKIQREPTTFLITNKEASQRQRELSLLYYVTKSMQHFLKNIDVVEKLLNARIKFHRCFHPFSISHPEQFKSINSITAYQFLPNTIEGLAFACKWSARIGQEPGIITTAVQKFSPNEQLQLEAALDSPNDEIRFLAANLFIAATAFDLETRLKRAQKDNAILSTIGNNILENYPDHCAFLNNTPSWVKSLCSLSYVSLESVEEQQFFCDTIRNAQKAALDLSICKLYQTRYVELQQMVLKHPTQKIAFIQQFFQINYPGYSILNEGKIPPPKEFETWIKEILKPAVAKTVAPVEVPSPLSKIAAPAKKKGKKSRSGKTKLSHVSYVYPKESSISASVSTPASDKAKTERVEKKEEKAKLGQPSLDTAQIKQALVKYPHFPYPVITDAHYDPRILEWMNSEIDEKQREQFFKHAFTDQVDLLAGSQKYSYYTKIRKENQEIHDLYVLFGVMIRDGSKVPEPIVVHYCIGRDKKIYHRYISNRTNIQILDDMIKAARDKYDSPTLQDAEVLKGVFKKGVARKRNDQLPHIGPQNIVCIRDEVFAAEFRFFEKPLTAES